MWNEAGDGQPLPRNFAVEMAIASGTTPRTARTQAQRWLASFQQRDEMAALVGDTAH